MNSSDIMRSLKYLSAYINPLVAIVGIQMGGLFTFANVIFIFGLVPIIDIIGPNSSENLSDERRSSAMANTFFDWLLYLNFPILIATLSIFIYTLETIPMATYEVVGSILSTGIVIGTCGLNIGHEIGHRNSAFNKYLSHLFLAPALYTHFHIEHNYGHHKNVATDLDPASARKGDILYLYWFKSMIGGYLNSWKIEKKRLSKLDKSSISLSNKMFYLTGLQLAYILIIYMVTSTSVFFYVIAAGFTAIFLLETINYLEHYGLRRKVLASGRYERVKPIHSWNANYQFGRILLYELTRHSDHHFIANKKFQILDHHESSPELPYGYPMMMVIAMIPPLWFKIMHPILENHKEASISMQMAI